MPNAPVLEGPRIVCVYLSFVAPGKPDILRGRMPFAEPLPLPLPPPPFPSDSSGESGGLGGETSSGHLTESESDAAVM
jgi:hypothetical protein